MYIHASIPMLIFYVLLIRDLEIGNGGIRNGGIRAGGIAGGIHTGGC